MGRMILFFLMAAGGAGGEVVSAVEEDTAVTLLEQRYSRETNPRKQAEIALDLMKHRVNQLRAAYETVEPERQAQAVEAFLDVLERLGMAVAAASHAGTSKKAEMHLRRQERDLGSLKTNVSYLERPAIEKVMARVAEVRAQILYSLLNPGKRN